MTDYAYVHIPFCKSKCFYCSFVSFADLELINSYLVALKSQIDSEYKGEKLTTLYFGGGTPSLLSIEQLQGVISKFILDDNTEFTVEVNPDSVNFDYLKTLKSIGVNRLSIGAQTFDDNILKLIGRRHNCGQIRSAVKFAKKAGFDNISLDFIYGLPNQTIKSFEIDLKGALDSGVQHISLYGLKIEPCSYFAQNMPQNVPDEDIQADMYLNAINVLSSAGYGHYEVSNFSLPKYESKHNLNYWNGNNYYGFGCSASGYVDRIRYTNEIDLENYINNPHYKLIEQAISEQEALDETIFLGLRKVSGINTEEINLRFGIDFNSKYASILKKYSDFFVKTDIGWAFSTNGLLISNIILAEFIN